MYTDRWYQAEAVDAVNSFLRENYRNSIHPCIALPTGAGKTIVIARLLEKWLTKKPDFRVVVVAHVQELVQQNYEKFCQVWGSSEIAGVYSAGLKRKELNKPITFCSIQSIYKKALHLGKVGAILVDEAHRIPTENESAMYPTFIRKCKEINPYCAVIGLTATPFRLKSGMVCAPDHILHKLVYEVSVRQLIDDGYLCPIKSFAGYSAEQAAKLKEKLKGVKQRGGEYVEYELDALMSEEDFVREACKRIVSVANETNRKQILIFCAGVKHGEMVSNMLRDEFDFSAPLLTGKTTKAEREELTGAMVRGELRALCNINVLSEGFDATGIDMVCLLRPTQSPGLMYQQIGRGLRLNENKDHCLVLDFAGNLSLHGPIDDLVTPKPKTSEPGEAPVKTCPQCMALVPIQAMECPECGHVFPKKFKPKHDVTPDKEAVVLTSERQNVMLGMEVESVSVMIWTKPGKPATLRVTYRNKNMLDTVGWIHTWIAFESQSPYAKRKAAEWWYGHTGQDSTMCPTTARHAYERILDHGIRTPSKIYYRKGYKNFPEIVSAEFDDITEIDSESISHVA